MKKIIILLACIASLVGCGKLTKTGLSITTMDSCQYVVYSTTKGAAITHHNNCKYCRERGKSFVVDSSKYSKKRIGSFSGAGFTEYTIAVDSLGNVIDTPTGKLKLHRY